MTLQGVSVSLQLHITLKETNSDLSKLIQELENRFKSSKNASNIHQEIDIRSVEQMSDLFLESLLLTFNEIASHGLKKHHVKSLHDQDE